MTKKIKLYGKPFTKGDNVDHKKGRISATPSHPNVSSGH